MPNARDTERLLSPVRSASAKPPTPGLKSGIALCLSGGGYRAMLFHLGALWRLNEWGYLPRLSRISSVSGGSIIAARLGQSWPRLDFDGAGQAVAFQPEVVGPVRGLAGKTLDMRAVALGLIAPRAISTRLSNAYDRHLFHGATLQDLPPDEEGPRFVINATNLQSGVLWRFSRPYMRDYRVGKIETPELPLATAVAASSAFPPVLSPVRLRFAEDEYVVGTGEDLQRPPFTTRPTLADGGIYDNLGLETAWHAHETVLISDGGGAMGPDPGGLGPLGGWRWRDWGSQSLRVLHVIDNQVRSLRKRQAIAAFQAEPRSSEHRKGTYWGIRSHIDDFGLSPVLPAPAGATVKLADVPTRLRALDDSTQERLVNWGYAICDTAMRKWVDPALSAPSAFPYPDQGVGVS